MWCKIWMLRQWGNWGWVLKYFWLCQIFRMDRIGFVGCIVSYRLDCIAGSYRISCIGLYCIVFGWIRKRWLLRIGWLLPGWDGWDGWTGWGVGGTGVGRTDVSRRRNGRATMGAGIDAPPLALEGCRCAGWLLPGWDGWYGWDGCTGWGVGGTGVGWTDVSRWRTRSATIGARTGAPQLALGRRRAMWSGSWHELCQCCKDAEYLCQRSKIIQIECPEIRTSNVVQDSIQITYDTIVLWLHTTINHKYNENIPKKKSQKKPPQICSNIEDSVRYKAE